MIKTLAFAAFVAFFAWNAAAPSAALIDGRHAQIELATR